MDFKMVAPSLVTVTDCSRPEDWRILSCNANSLQEHGKWADSRSTSACAGPKSGWLKEAYHSFGTQGGFHEISYCNGSNKRRLQTYWVFLTWINKQMTYQTSIFSLFFWSFISQNLHWQLYPNNKNNDCTMYYNKTFTTTLLRQSLMKRMISIIELLFGSLFWINRSQTTKMNTYPWRHFCFAGFSNTIQKRSRVSCAQGTSKGDVEKGSFAVSGQNGEPSTEGSQCVQTGGNWRTWKCLVQYEYPQHACSYAPTTGKSILLYARTIAKVFRCLYLKRRS